jgi:hypothetical protein
MHLPHRCQALHLLLLPGISCWLCRCQFCLVPCCCCHISASTTACRWLLPAPPLLLLLLGLLLLLLRQ